MNIRSLYRTIGVALPFAIEGTRTVFSSEDSRTRGLIQKIAPSNRERSFPVTSSLFFSIAHAEGTNFSAELKEALEKIKMNPLSIQDLSPRMKNNEQVVLAAVQEHGWALDYASPDMKNNERVVLAAVQKHGFALRYASPEMKNNERVVLAAVQNYGSVLEYVSPEMQNNERVVLAAVQKHGWALDYASPEMKNNERVVLAAVQKYGWTLEYASPEMQNNERVVLAAVQNYGLALKYASPKMQNNERVVLTAVQYNGEVLRYASEKLRNQKNIVLAALHQDADAYQYVGESLRNDPDIVSIVRGSEGLSEFSVAVISEQIKFFREYPNSIVGLFSSDQIYKDGAVDKQEVGVFLRKLRAKAKEGIYFTNPESDFLSGGTCSAMTSMFINQIAPKKIRRLQQLEEAFKEIANNSPLQGCITKSCEGARNLQTAFNAIRISKKDKQSNLDFSKHKIESLAQVYGISIGKTSNSLSIRDAGAVSNFKEEIEKLPKGVYWLRALNKADNDKLENFGHSLAFIKGEDFFGLYDPSVGMKIASVENMEVFIKDLVLFSLRRYALHEARFYEVS